VTFNDNVTLNHGDTDSIFHNDVNFNVGLGSKTFTSGNNLMFGDPGTNKHVTLNGLSNNSALTINTPNNTLTFNSFVDGLVI